MSLSMLTQRGLGPSGSFITGGLATLVGAPWAVASLALPTLFITTHPRGNVNALSVFVALLLITSYGAYMLYDIAGFRGGRGVQSDAFMTEASEAVVALIEDDGGPEWPVAFSLVGLAVASILVALESDVLVSAVVPTMHALGISEFFVGLIVIPIVGHVAEHLSAVQLAVKNEMDLSFVIASG